MSNLIVLKETPLTSYLNVMMRDKNASRAQFVTYSNRLVRLLIEEAMALLPLGASGDRGLRAAVRGLQAARRGPNLRRFHPSRGRLHARGGPRHDAFCRRR